MRSGRRGQGESWERRIWGRSSWLALTTAVGAMRSMRKGRLPTICGVAVGGSLCTRKWLVPAGQRGQASR